MWWPIVNVHVRLSLKEPPYVRHLDFPLSAGISAFCAFMNCWCVQTPPGLPRSLAGAESNR